MASRLSLSICSQLHVLLVRIRFWIRFRVGASSASKPFVPVACRWFHLEILLSIGRTGMQACSSRHLSLCVSRSMAWRSMSLPVLFILACQQNFALWSARPLLGNVVWPCHRSKSLTVCPLAFDFQMHQSKLNVLQAHWPLLWIIVIPICAQRRYHAILSSSRNLVRDAFTS